MPSGTFSETQCSAGLSAFKCNVAGRFQKMRISCSRVRNGRSKSLKFVNFSTNRKRECNFLLVNNSDIDGFLRNTANIANVIFRSIFGDVPVRLGCRYRGSKTRRLWATGKYSYNYFLWPRFINCTYRETGKTCFLQLIRIFLRLVGTVDRLAKA